MKEQVNVSQHQVTPAAAQSEAARPESDNHLPLELISKLPVQRKLSIGSVDDPLEAQADYIANQVMRMPTSHVQRKCSHCKEEETLQRKSLRPFIQRSSQAEGTVASEEITSRINSTKGGGSPLPSESRTFMESRFGTDFSGVRIHTGDYAAQLSGDLNAQAFTTGNDIYFNAGKFQPHSSTGNHLLAHELTHVVQQSSGTISPKIMRQWDRPGTECAAEPTGKWIRTVVVEQEKPQSVTLHWSDGTIESGICSTGKGLCCTDSPEGVTCSVSGSRVTGTNCTPITTGDGYAISDRYLNYNGWRFWNTFVGYRGIALHQHHTVTGEPLSHGCVRMNEAMARRIFCGSRQNRTRVQVRGFARPECSSAQLQAEWLSDVQYAQLPTDGESSSVVRGIRETRSALGTAFGTSTDPELNSTLRGINATNILSHIPRCASRAATLNFEERPLTADFTNASRTARIIPAGTFPMQLLVANGFYHFIPDFEAALDGASNFSRAERTVRTHGLLIWNRSSAARTNPNYDERLLYWTRVAFVRTIHQWNPSFSILQAQRDSLVDAMEKASRGMTSATFTGRRDVKRILISGFDPFFLRQPTAVTTSLSFDIANRNPSGAVALYMDNRLIHDPGNTVSGRVQSVIFPVRFTDFNAGMVENFFRPYLSGTNAPHMIMTISQGGSDFEVEQSAGRLRASGAPGNEGILGGGQTTPITPPGLSTTDPLTLPTTLPAAEMRRVLGRSLPTAGEIDLSASGGSGGDYLSNEIFYRTRLLRDRNNSLVKMGHLHIPHPSVTPVSQVITTVENILKNVLTSI
jgi:pyrrolidone-carboxylate peptidase